MSRPFKIYDSVSPPLFDGNDALCFIVQLRSSVTNARVRNIAPGALYTFIIHQDATGGHSFVWPSECIDAAEVDMRKNTTTVQNFIGDTGGLLKADLAGTWSKT